MPETTKPQRGGRGLTREKQGRSKVCPESTTPPAPRQGCTPANRILTACQKMQTLAGRCDLSKYVNQITMAVAYMEANR